MTDLNIGQFMTLRYSYGFGTVEHTHIRDLEESLRIQKNSAIGQYIFTSNITALFSPDKVLSLHTGLT